MFISARTDRLLLRTVVRSRAVLGQAHTLRRLTPLAALALAILVAPAIGGANSSQSQTNLRAQAAQLAAKQRAAVLGLYSLDQQLAAARAHLAALGLEQSRLRAERAVLGRQLAIARHDSKLAQRNLAGRLRTLYEQGNVEPLEILFGAKNLDDAITSIDSLNRVAAQDKTILRQVRTARTALGAASRTLAARADALRAATREAAATEASLAGAKAARRSYISSLASQRRLTEQQISTLVAQARAAQIRTQQ